MKVHVKRVHQFSPDDSADFCIGFDIPNVRYTCTEVIRKISSDYCGMLIDRGLGCRVNELTEAGEYYCPITSYVTGDVIFVAKAFSDKDGVKVKLYGF